MRNKRRTRILKNPMTIRKDKGKGKVSYQSTRPSINLTDLIPPLSMSPLSTFPVKSGGSTIIIMLHLYTIPALNSILRTHLSTRVGLHQANCAPDEVFACFTVARLGGLWALGWLDLVLGLRGHLRTMGWPGPHWDDGVSEFWVIFL